jgi:predicted lipase
VVSFRGTVPTSIQNWLANVQYFQVSAPFKGATNGLVHTGFLQSYKNVSAAVISEVLNLRSQFPNYNIVLTGHSLGGAQTTLLAMDLYYNYSITNAYLITFGSPRVGDPAFAISLNNAYAGRSWRVTHAADIVPQVPLRVMPPITFFHHPGTEVWYNTGIYIATPDGEDPNGSDSNLVALSVPDHLIYLGVLYLVCL